MRQWRRWVGSLLVAIVLLNAVVLAVLPEGRAEVRRFVTAWTNAQPSAGFALRTYVDAAGHRYKYSLFVPHQPSPPDGYPVLLYLNGRGKNGDDGLKHLRDGLAPVLWERQQEFPFLVVFPQCPEGENWHPDGAAARRAFAILDEVGRDYPMDADRIGLTGLSSGGWGVWAIAARFPQRFAAIAPISSGPPQLSAAQAIAAAGLPVWSFYVRGDAESVVDGCRRMHSALIDAGGSPRFTELDGTRDERWSAHNAWDHAFRNPRLFAWLLRQRSSANVRQAEPFRRLFDPRHPDGFRCSAPMHWRIEPGWIECASPSDEDCWIATTEAFANLELHLEFHPGPAGTWGVALKEASDESAATGWLLELRAPEQGVCSLRRRPQMNWLCDGDPLAQRSMRIEEWNDLRITVRDQTLQVELNGWPLLSYHEPALGMQPAGIAIMVPNGNETRLGWQNVRVRAIH